MERHKRLGVFRSKKKVRQYCPTQTGKTDKREAFCLVQTVWPDGYDWRCRKAEPV